MTSGTQSSCNIPPCDVSVEPTKWTTTDLSHASEARLLMSVRGQIALVAIVLCAIALRAVLFFERLSFWNDEAAIVINLVDRDARALSAPLDYAQIAPLGFLLIHRVLLGTRPPDEYLLRAPDLAAAVLGVIIFAVVAKRAYSTPAALFAVALFAGCGRILHNSIQVKQYGWDVLASVILMLFVAGPDRDRNDKPITFGILGAILFWFSFPAVFAFAAIWLAMTLRIRGAVRPTLRCVASLLPAAISLSALYRVTLAKPQDPYFLQYWASAFPNGNNPVVWLGRQIYKLFDYPCPGAGFLLFAAVIAGAVWLWRDGRRTLVMISIGIVAGNVLAAYLGRYPFTGSRVTIYFTPWLFLLAGAGLRRGSWPAVLGRWSYVLPMLLLTSMAAPTLAHAFNPPTQSTMRPVAGFVKTHYGKDQPIFLIADGDQSRDRITGRYLEFLCYWRSPPAGVVFGFPNASTIPATEFWVVYSRGNRSRAEIESRLRPIERECLRADEFRTELAGAILFRKMPPDSEPSDRYQSMNTARLRELSAEPE